ncbi:hypothetical protein DACRYDRAFT_114933 [Dacryopinax primogenitus]|uniref:mRNA decay factor PAT1 domain-containing protein n=1 Tax=Dacryopinax primogenitus (strain DJM 731) TaxID=1858805 RepID=M5G5R4_DACPD|nr:uncharacterized protein DACRYDRAFT_114933 [Dacryopinax primogenitus]EJU03555.1 hypothetical protein DACRYDRAFT_114933 [Dacryopinax primogenitus]
MAFRGFSDPSNGDNLLSSAKQEDEDLAVYNWDDEGGYGYDIGTLEEEGDDMNDETFGGGNVGTDFQFARTTGTFAPASRAPPKQEHKPAPISSHLSSARVMPNTSNRPAPSIHKGENTLEALWKDNSVSSVLGGIVPSGGSLMGARHTPPTHTPTPPRPTNIPPPRASQPRIMTLQEIEAEMEAQSRGGIAATHSMPQFPGGETYAPPPRAPVQVLPQIPIQSVPHPSDGHFLPQQGYGLHMPRNSMEGLVPQEIRPASGGRQGFPVDGHLPPELRPAGGTSPYHPLPENTFTLPSMRPDMELPPEIRHAGGRVLMDVPILPPHMRAAPMQGPPAARDPFYPPQNQIFSLDEIERQMQSTRLGGPMPQQPMPQGPLHNIPDMGPMLVQQPPHVAPFEDLHQQVIPQQQQRPESGLFKGDIADLLDFPPLGGQPLAGHPMIGEHPPNTRTPEQIIELSVEKRAALMRDAQEKIKATERLEAKRRRKAEKLAHMSRRNELMSQGDKDFITRIQVSQLVTEDPYADDFYAQVFGAIVRSRMGQSGGGEAVIKFGDVGVGMGIGRGAGRREKAMERMRQQVEKLVQHAKNREKEKDTDQEKHIRALGKLTSRTSKVAPRPLLQVRDIMGSPPITPPSDRNRGTDRKSAMSHRDILLRIEKLYDIVLQLEQKRREEPHGEEQEPQKQEWEMEYAALVKHVWTELHVMDPLDISDPHPVIALLGPAKGKKLLPRILRHLSQKESLTVVTLLIACFSQIDVVRKAYILDKPDSPEKLEMEKQTELFLSTILPALISALRRAGLRLVSGLLGHLITRCNVAEVARTRPGLELLTMFLAQAEGLKHASEPDAPSAEELEQWQKTCTSLFSALSGTLLALFPSARRHAHLPFGTAQYIRQTAADDVADQPTWQFLAALAISADMAEQQHLVGELRDKVLENVMSQRTGLATTEEEARMKIDNVNLFLNALGIDASQIQM